MLFDRYILFRLSQMLTHKYDTKTFIKLMNYLIKIDSGHTIADLALGSGGFLVHRYNNELSQDLIYGCDLSRMGPYCVGQLALHNINRINIEIGNSLSICTGKGPLADNLFDRILMNPPFGERVDSKQVKEAIGRLTGSRSEAALLGLTLNKLSTNGKACILVPSGFLSGDGNAEQGLRRQIIDNNSLEAIVSLPKDALQPFSPIQTYLLLIQRTCIQVTQRGLFVQKTMVILMVGVVTLLVKFAKIAIYLLLAQ